MDSMEPEGWPPGSGCISSKDGSWPNLETTAYVSMLTSLLNSITIVVGIAVSFILPDFPETWGSLSPELKSVAIKRMAMDASKADVDVGGRSSVWSGFKMAFTDPKVSVLGFPRASCLGL